MCELCGLGSDQRVQPGELLCRFGARGGDTADNPDGWGVAEREDDSFLLAEEPLSAAQSRLSLIPGRCARPPAALCACLSTPTRFAVTAITTPPAEGAPQPMRTSCHEISLYPE